jgi:hypothetical protein
MREDGETHINTASGKQLFFRINNLFAMCLNSNGAFGIGTSSPLSRLHLNNGEFTMNSNGTFLKISPMIANLAGNNRRVVTYDITPFELGSYECIHAFLNSVSVTNDFNAVTKNFVIKHPILEDKQLVHCSVEAPRADLIYSGIVKLHAGRARVEIDSASCPNSPMTKGTFEALTRNPRVYLQNNDGWTAVKGKVVGGILEIQAQNRGSDDEIHWMIVAERQDEGIRRSMRTNEGGYLMTEVVE